MKKNKKIVNYSDFKEKKDDVIAYLYSFKMSELNSDIHDLITCSSNEDRTEIIQNILLVISDKLSDDDYQKLEADLNKEYPTKKKK